MRCLLIHNHYQNAGGEDEVFRNEAELLRSHGHDVIEYVRNNDEIRNYRLANKIGLAFRTVWAQDTVRDLRALLKREKPEIVHLHNTFPLVSPAVYYACDDAEIPVVQTLHNYRLLCPSATLFRKGHVCEECLDHTLLRSIRHGCYRGSRTGTAVVAGMLWFHRFRRTWIERVDRFVALTQFSRQKFAANGIPEKKISVRPNSLARDPGPKTGTGEYALFVGRVSPEKGLATLLSAWQRLPRQVVLKIVGDGPQRQELHARALNSGLDNVSFEGLRSRAETLAAMKGARFLIFPSQWYECFPATLLEAFACGLPVIASNIGAVAEIVNNGVTGLHVVAGDACDLAEKIHWAWTHPREIECMGRNARLQYEAKYSPEQNYERLMEIYRSTVASRASARIQTCDPAIALPVVTGKNAR
jgi:glycosyltransferase involved in cell wall biosynthesis